VDTIAFHGIDCGPVVHSDSEKCDSFTRHLAIISVISSYCS
jgi:hypothetical protein